MAIQVIPPVAEYMENSIHNGNLYAIWSVDDIRQLPSLVWQHLIPRLRPDLADFFKGLDLKAEDSREKSELTLARSLRPLCFSRI